MKKLAFLAMILCAALLTFSAAAEYVPCLVPGEAHTQSEWTVVETRADGTQLLERTCSKCGYVQKGYGVADGAGVATTRDAVAVTTMITAPGVDVAINANPPMGAAA
ncbi:MAG: hypothetical protein RRY21_03265 [Oscillospiraceae bacterium]